MIADTAAEEGVHAVNVRAGQNFGEAQEKVAQKLIEKYQKSSCEELKSQKEQPPDPQQAAMKQKAVAALKNDPKMREQFLSKVAGPIANKLFECGMVP